MTGWPWAWLLGSALLGAAALVTVAMALFGDPARQRSRWLVVLLLLVALGPAAWRTGVAVEALVFYPLAVMAGPGALPPQFAYVAPRDTHILGLAWSADGGRLLVYLQVGALDLWSVLVGFWPELLLAVLAPVALVLIWRFVRRPGSPGPHCRRCSYLLVACESDRCPECGLALTPRNRVRGVRRRWQVSVAVALPLILLVGYGLAATSLPRIGAVTAWFRWPSTALYDLAYRWDRFFPGFANAHKIEVYSLVEMDPASGRIPRVLLRSTDTLRPWNRMALSHEGTLLAVIEGESLWIIDPDSGQRHFRFESPPPSQAGAFNFFNAVACSPDGRYVYAADWEGSVFMWDAATGEVLKQISVDSLLADRPLSGSAILRAIDPAPRKDRLVLLINHFHKKQDSFVVRTDDHLAVQRTLHVEPAELLNKYNEVSLTVSDPEGASWYGLEAQGDLLVVYLDGDAPPERRSLRGDTSFGLGISPDGAMLIVGRIRSNQMKSVTELYSTNPWARLARLGGDSLTCRTFAFSRDGMRLSAGGWHSPRTTAWSRAGAIEIYDLRALPAETMAQPDSCDGRSLRLRDERQPLETHDLRLGRVLAPYGVSGSSSRGPHLSLHPLAAHLGRLTTTMSSVLCQHVAGSDVPCPSCGFNLRDLTADHCPECGTHLRLAVIADRPRIASFVAGLIGLAGAVGVPFCWIIVVALMGFHPATKGEWVGAAGFVLGLIISAAFLAAWVMFYPRYRRLRPLVRWLLAVACFVWAVGSLVTPVIISEIIDA